MHFATQWPRIGAGCVEQLDEWLSNHPGCVLVVIDTLARVKPPRGRNGDIYAEDYAAVAAFKELSERHGITVILVHHLRKQGAENPADMLSGTTGLSGGVDGTLILTKSASSKFLTLHRQGRDLIDDDALTLDWNKESGEWSVVDQVAVAAHDVSEARKD
ncbi:MAG: helicase RepA family protein, partial [Magnetococcus sp. XQGC-1]